MPGCAKPPPEERSRLVRGPISALQATLLQYGWCPVGPRGWERHLQDVSRERWAFPDVVSITEGSCQAILDAFDAS
eukprot:4625612-Pyramimonas_sp.AAC.1